MDRARLRPRRGGGPNVPVDFRWRSPRGRRGRPDVCRGDPTGAQSGADNRLRRLPRTSRRRPVRSERLEVRRRPDGRHPDNERLAGERDGHAKGPPGDRLRRFLHLRRRQSGTCRPLFRRALDRRQSPRPRSGSRFARGQGYARAMDRPVVPSLGLFLADSQCPGGRAERPAPVLHNSPLWLLGRDHSGGHPLCL